jgi:AcrR family transcriptional regulator
MSKPKKTKPQGRTPLTRERLLRAAMSLADAQGIEAVSMRRVAETLEVEAMSLYRHVANKDEILDGLVELVISEIEIPDLTNGWRAVARGRAMSMREVLLRHRWAAMLMESRVSPGPARLRMHNAQLKMLRDARFPIALAYNAFLTLDSYIYGFVLQEVWWPFTAEDRPEVIESLRPEIPVNEYPYIVEMMHFVMGRTSANAAHGYEADFAFGLDLILDGFERTLCGYTGQSVF